MLASPRFKDTPKMSAVRRTPIRSPVDRGTRPPLDYVRSAALAS